MPETISLNAYLARLDDLLAANATDEVIHHCRHILKYTPKNVATYRTLGRALLYSARWDAARAIFRRVLGVYPDDYVAHIALSEINDQQGQGNEAIWHLERAYEQEPNNGDLIDSLRELYRKYHHSDQTRIQLTAAAVARQYTRSGLYDQAIDLLRSSLERMPTRLDLKVLLAESLWENDQHIEAAEHALDLLRVLPDCMMANRILSQLWLQEERPSDAQRFLNRLEAVDPYLALTLVEGHPADDRAFTLELLDYRRIAQTELATAQPDWLTELGARPDASHSNTSSIFTEDVAAVPAFEGDWTEFVPDNERPVAQTAVDDGEHSGFTDDLPSLTTTDHLKLRELSSDVESARERLSDSDRVFDDKVEGFERSESMSETHARDLRSATSMHASIFGGKAPDSDELPEWVVSPTGDEEIELPPGSDLASAADPLAWLRGTGIDVNDAITQRAQRPDEHPAVFSSKPVDPLAWVRDSDIDFGAGTSSNEAQNSGDEEDPYAWMTGGDIDLDLDLGTFTPSKPLIVEDNDDHDLFAWMRESRMRPGVETSVEASEASIEAPLDESLIANDSIDNADADDSDSDPFADPFAWMRDSKVDNGAATSTGEPAAAPLAASLTPDDNSADDLNWMRASLVSSAIDEADEVEIELDAELEATFEAELESELHANPTDDEDPFAWMRESGIDLDDLDEDSAPSPTPFANPEDETDPLAWLRASGIEYDEDAQPDKAWTDPYDTADQTPINDPASNPLGWMQGYDLGADPDLAESLRPQSVQTGQPDQTGQDDPFAWLHDSSLDTNDRQVAESEADDDIELEDTFEWLKSLDLGDLLRDDERPQ